jgi:hypothetical protein
LHAWLGLFSISFWKNIIGGKGLNLVRGVVYPCIHSNYSRSLQALSWKVRRGPEVYEMERSGSLRETKQSTKLEIGEDHSATINVAFIQSIEKRKPCHRAIHC